MIEIRVVNNGVMCRLDFQYRYKNQLPQGCIASPDWKEWSAWQTAEWVEALEFNGICRDNCQGTKISSLPGLPE